MPPIVHEDAAATTRLTELGLTAADLAAALRGADAEARKWTRLAPQLMPGMVRWGRPMSCCGLPDRTPATKYAKGVQTVLAIGRNVQLAFDLTGVHVEDALWAPVAREDDLATWLLLYHVTPEEIRAELSLANGIDLRGHVSAWIERIILPVIDLTGPVG